MAPRNPALEGAVRADRTDPGPVGVYADWLQAAGDPAGELIVLQQRAALDPAQRDRIAELHAQLGLPDAALASATLRFGIWKSLRVENTVDWMDDEFDAVAAYAPAFASPLCVALEELRIAILRWEYQNFDAPKLVAFAGEHAWAANLEALAVGDVEDDIDMAHHQIGEIGAPISKSFPNLRSLHLHSGDTFGLAGLALPVLERLVIETCALTHQRLADLLTGSLPALTSLELWFGAGDRDCDLTDVQPLAPLLAGRVFPRLSHLGLRNTDLADAIAEVLPAADIAGRLVSLDLSMGTLTAIGADHLIAGRAAFANLTRLDVDDNFLGGDQVAALRAAFHGVEVVSKTQKTEDTSLVGEVYRYVSISE